MHHLASIALVVSSGLSALAILTFSWSVALAKSLLPFAGAAAVVGATAAGLAGGLGAMAVWAFLFACAACGCYLNAARQLFARPTRWVHRFVIYVGYGATFALMAALGPPLEERAATGWLAGAVFIGIYVAGSVCIFLAKTLTVRRAVKTMPEYQASRFGEQQGRSDQNDW